MSPLSIYNVSGWHTRATMGIELPVDKEGATTLNLLRIAGYVPVFGIVTGIVDINGGIKVKNMDLTSRICAVVRGILEILGLGILFLIVDIAVSIHRHFCSEEQNKLRNV